MIIYIYIFFCGDGDDLFHAIFDFLSHFSFRRRSIVNQI